MQLLTIFGLICLVSWSNGLENGLARTPPMGFMTWQRFRCIIDCDLYPLDCISEQNIMAMADMMSQNGYLDAGYEYLIVDDCWLATERDAEGKLQPDAARFPSGIKALSDYVHSVGLKFGIYEDYGNYTCAGYPGILGSLELDAQTFADWEVDYIKVDACYAPADMESGYIEFGGYLNQTGRPIVYSCSWPAYQETSGINANYELLSQHCNLWRNYGDIQDSWGSVVNIADWFANNQDRISPYHGPGHWNDPDMLLAGNFGLSYDQAKAQMAIWCVFASPLLMSVDLRTIKPEFASVLLNEKAIAINQDELGIQGKLILKTNNINVWQKPMLPMVNGEYSYGLAFVSLRTDGIPYHIQFPLDQLGMTNANGYDIDNIFEGEVPTMIPQGGSFSIKVNPTGVIFVKATPIA